MKAKEKAKDLVRLFYNNQCSHSVTELAYKSAKQCALICVDEMLEEILSTLNVYELDTYYYWKKVKQEINKL